MANIVVRRVFRRGCPALGFTAGAPVPAATSAATKTMNPMSPGAAEEAAWVGGGCCRGLCGERTALGISPAAPVGATASTLHTMSITLRFL